jgi:hypothetical protein
MTFRPSQHATTGIRTFYVSSESREGVEYAVQRIRRSGMNRWQCSCPVRLAAEAHPGGSPRYTVMPCSRPFFA